MADEGSSYESWTKSDTDRPCKPGIVLFAREPNRSIEPGQTRSVETGRNTSMTTHARNRLRFGILNIGTYKDKEEELLNLMKERNLDVLGLSETRLKNKESGRDLGDNYILAFSGVEQGIAKYGVAMLVGPRLSKRIKMVKLVNERIMRITLQFKRGKMHILQVYAPQQGLSNQVKEQFYEDLQAETELLPNDEAIIVMGDLNGRVGSDRTNVENVIGPFGEETRNDDGDSLIDWCLINNMSVMNGFFKQRESHKFTRYRWNRNTGQFDQKSVIDYFLSSDKRLFNNVKVLPGDSMDSDHRLVIAVITQEIKRAPLANKIRKIKVENLKDAPHKEEFVEKCQEIRLEGGENNISVKWKYIVERMKEISEESLGVRMVGGTRKRHTPWWTEEMKVAVKKKTKSLRKWLRHKTPETRLDYVVERRNVDRLKRTLKEKAWKDLAEELKEDLKRNKKLIYKLSKSFRNPRNKCRNIVDENGQIITEPEQINEKWTEYFTNLLNVPQDEPEEEGEEEVEIEINPEDTVSMAEMKDALKEMSNGKACGTDELPIELFKEASENIRVLLLDIINQSWLEEISPEDWGKQTICPFFKKGDPTKCENYRGISLINHAAKLYERILEKRARAIIEPQLGEWQHGFRKSRGTTDMIFSIRQLMEKAWEFNQKLYMIFIDLRKAFDSVSRKRLWNCLSEYGISGQLLKAIKSTYSPCISKVNTEHKNDKWFEITSGVKQGSILSPLLFITYMDRIMKLVNINQEIPMHTLAYADDICHWETSKERLQDAAEVWDRVLSEAGLSMNKVKTEVMVFGRGEEVLDIRLDGTTLPQAKEFKYLGVTVKSTGGIHDEITERINKYSRQFHLLYPIFKEKHIPTEVKRLIYTTVLIPTLTYGAETWTLTTTDMSRLVAAEMKPIRLILGKTIRDQIRNEELRRRLEVISLESRMEQAKLRWLGHVQRMEGGRIPKLAFNWTPNGRRLTGRPRKRWRDSIQEILTKYRIGRLSRLEEEDIFQDRVEWRRRCSALTG